VGAQAGQGLGPRHEQIAANQVGELEVGTDGDDPIDFPEGIIQAAGADVLERLADQGIGRGGQEAGGVGGGQNEGRIRGRGGEEPAWPGGRGRYGRKVARRLSSFLDDLPGLPFTGHQKGFLVAAFQDIRLVLLLEAHRGGIAANIDTQFLDGNLDVFRAG
jgi:hypothetical protein